MTSAALPWRTSQASAGEECVEVAILADSVCVRHSRTADPVLVFTLPEWRAFLAGARHGEFDVPDTQPSC